MKENLRIVFMGTPDFAVSTLRAIYENNYHIVGVITAPDKPAGRGKKIQMSAVKEFCLAHDIHVLTPSNLKDPLFLDELKSLNPDLQIVVAFRMLPAVVWEIPTLGTFNLHASLLPQYRGAAPINHCLINGDSLTGVTTFFINHQIDTGNIIAQKTCPILPEDNAGSLHDKLASLGAQLVLETIDAIERKEVIEKPQNELLAHEELKSAPKIFKEDCLIRWSGNCQDILNFIRGLSPYPAAWTKLVIPGEPSKILSVKIFEGRVSDIVSVRQPGSIRIEGKSFYVSTFGFELEILELQLEGKKRMKTDEFLRGFLVEEAMFFE